jgi:hypothetical protein
MPKILNRLVGQLEKKGMNQGQAFAVATKTLQKSGSLKPGSQDMTAKGKARSAMGAAGRAKDRASAASGHSKGDYKYNQLTNTARLKK